MYYTFGIFYDRGEAVEPRNFPIWYPSTLQIVYCSEEVSC